MPRVRIIDVEVLQVLLPSRISKKKSLDSLNLIFKKSTPTYTLEYTLRHNHFAKSFTKTRYKIGEIKWFQCKVKNLHGHIFKFGLTRGVFNIKRDPKSGIVKVSGMYAEQMLVMLRYLNASFNYMILKSLDGLKMMDYVPILSTTITPYHMLREFSYTKPTGIVQDVTLIPALHYKSSVFDLSKLLMILVEIAVIIAMIKLTTRVLSLFDTDRWSILMIFSSLLDVECNRGLSSFADKCMYLCVFCISFFFSESMFFGIVDTLYSIKHEIDIWQPNELIKFNFKPFVTESIKDNLQTHQYLTDFELFTYNKSYTFNRCLKDAILHKNTSCSLQDTFLGAISRVTKIG